MTKKGVEAYRRRNPGSKLKTAVTTPPSKLKPEVSLLIEERVTVQEVQDK